MVVTCPGCGATSHDAEFCDHCNAELAFPTDDGPPATCPLRSDQPVPLSADQISLLSRPEAFICLARGAQTWRVHWVSQKLWEKYRPTVEERRQLSLRVLPPCHVVPDTSGVWLAAEAA